MSTASLAGERVAGIAALPRRIRNVLLNGFGGRGIMAIADQGFASGTTFVSGAIVARSASTQQFGLYSLVLIALFWGYSMQGALVTTPYTFRRRQLDGVAQQEYAGAVLGSQITVAATLAFGLAAASFAVRFVEGSTASALAPVLLAAGVAAAACMLRECCRQLSFAHELLGAACALDASVAVIQLTGLIILSHLNLLNASTAFLMIGASVVVPTAVWLWAHRGMFKRSKGAVLRHAIESWRFGRWIVAGVLVHSLAKDTFPWILGIVHGASAAATLAAGFGIAFLVNPILSATTNVLGPFYARRLADDGPDALRALVRRSTVIALAAGGAYAVVLMLAGPWLTSLIYGAQYAASGRIAGWLALGIAASAITLPIGVALYAMHRTEVTFRAVCVAAAIAVVVSGPLVYWYAAWGVALALLIENIGESVAKTVWYLRLVSVWRGAPSRQVSDLAPTSTAGAAT
jgi:O-antigen/teichoic acid export membrane protein